MRSSSTTSPPLCLTHTWRNCCGLPRGPCASRIRAIPQMCNACATICTTTCCAPTPRRPRSVPPGCWRCIRARSARYWRCGGLRCAKGGPAAVVQGKGPSVGRSGAVAGEPWKKWSPCVCACAPPFNAVVPRSQCTVGQKLDRYAGRFTPEYSTLSWLVAPPPQLPPHKHPISHAPPPPPPALSLPYPQPPASPAPRPVHK